MNIRERILEAKDIREEEVEIEEWGVKIRLRGLTGKERARLLQDAAKKDGTVNLERMYPDLLILSARDPETDAPVFVPADRDLLNEKAGGVLEELAQKIMDLSAMSKKVRDEVEGN